MYSSAIDVSRACWLASSRVRVTSRATEMPSAQCGRDMRVSVRLFVCHTRVLRWQGKDHHQSPSTQHGAWTGYETDNCRRSFHWRRYMKTVCGQIATSHSDAFYRTRCRHQEASVIVRQLLKFKLMDIFRISCRWTVQKLVEIGASSLKKWAFKCSGLASFCKWKPGCLYR